MISFFMLAQKNPGVYAQNGQFQKQKIQSHQSDQNQLIGRNMGKHQVDANESWGDGKT